MLVKNLQPKGVTLPSDRYIAAALPRTLTSFDLLTSHMVVVLWLINATSAATVGMTGLIYWVIGGVLFYLPSVIASAQLAVLFPQDSSLYVWTRKSLATGTGKGRLTSSLFWSFVVGLCFWLVGPLALVIGANAFFTFVQGIIPASLFAAVLSQPWQQGVLLVAVCVFYNLVAVQRARVVQNMINAVFWLNLLALVLVVGAACTWLLCGHPSATPLSQEVDGASLLQNHFLLGLICLGYLGAPTVLALGGELSERYTTVGSTTRAITRHAFLALPMVIVSYLLATLALMITRGQALATSADLNFELVTAVDVSLGKGVGNIAVVCSLAFFLISPIFYHLASSRILLVAAIDQRLPRSFGLMNKYRVPAHALWFQTGAAIFIIVVIYFVAPLLTPLGKPTDLATQVYYVVLATLTLVSLLSMLFLYINLVVLYRRDRAFLLSRLIVPLPLLGMSAFCGTALCLLIIGDSLLNSWIPLIDNRNWSISVGGLLMLILVLASILSAFASSEAQWQGLKEASADVAPPMRHSTATSQPPVTEKGRT